MTNVANAIDIWGLFLYYSVMGCQDNQIHTQQLETGQHFKNQVTFSVVYGA